MGKYRPEKNPYLDTFHVVNIKLLQKNLYRVVDHTM